MRHILAIEPDPKRAGVLERLVDEQVQARLVVVRSKEAALAAIAEGVPDLILAPALLSPRDEAELMSLVRQLPDAQHLQVLVTPPLADPDETATVQGGMLAVFRRRRSQPAWDQRAAAGTQIRDYLELAHQFKRELNLTQDGALAHGAEPDLGPELSAHDLPAMAATSIVIANLSRESQALVRHIANERRRACRRTRQEVPWLSTINLPDGIEVQLLNISTSGALVTTSAKFAPGSATEFRLFGPGTKLVVPARFVRIDVAAVDPLRGVEYHAAAAFDKPVDLLDSQPRPAGGSSTPEALEDLVAQLRAARDRGVEPAALRARFETGLRELVPVRDIQIRDVPVGTSKGRESIYFAVPGGSGSSAILQAMFEPNYELTESEFRLLKAAAAVAAFVFEPDSPLVV